jgi:phosphohistidine swiveling domain-containing protein
MPESTGTPIPISENFPVAWPDPQDKTLAWQREYMHCPEAMPALAGDFWLTVWNGMDHSREYSGAPRQALLCWINNYIYMAFKLTVEPDEEEAANKKAEEARAAFGENVQTHWQEEFLPEIQDYIERWDRFDLEAASTTQLQQHMDETWDWLLRIWTLHFRLGSGHGRETFTNYYKELFGEDCDLAVVRRLVQGLPNKTTAMGQALWDLSQRLPREFAETINENSADKIRAALERSTIGKDFLAALDEFLAAFGHRGNHWGLQYPTWIEDPTPVFVMLRGYLSTERDPEAVFTAQTAEREQALSEVRGQLQGYPQTARDRFEKLLDLAHVSEMLRENHNFWIDYSCTSRVRRLMLAAGRRLVAAGIIVSTEDVLHLHVDEVRTAFANNLSEDLRALIASRQTALEQFSAIEPPPHLGVEPPPEDTDTTSEPPPPDEPGLLRGQPGAPGTACGPARIVTSIADAHTLAAGEILVAQSTGPSLTPLFAIAGGLVTEIGGALSHCAVVAREYRVPAVVSLSDARRQIADGQWIEIDGDAGTVRLVE